MNFSRHKKYIWMIIFVHRKFNLTQEKKRKLLCFKSTIKTLSEFANKYLFHFKLRINSLLAFVWRKCPLNVNKISFKAHTYIRQGKIRYWSKGTTLCGTRRKYQNKLHKVKKIFCDIMKIRWIVRIFWCLAEMSPIAFWRF